MAEEPNSGMYKVQPLYDCFQVLDLPTCMFKVENIHGNVSDVETKEQSDVAALENYQIQVLKKLEHLKENVLELKNALGILDTSMNDMEDSTSSLLKSSWIKTKPAEFQDVVISASPEFPPLSIWALYNLIIKKIGVRFTTHVHSSLTQVPEIVRQLKVVGSEEPCDLALTIIWKHVLKDPAMMVDPINQGIIEGEVNIARYIARLVKFNYEEDAITSTQIDSWLEMVHSSMIHGNNKERQATLRSLNSHLGCHSFLVGKKISVADIVMWSAILQANLQGSLPTNVSIWWKSLNNSCIFPVPLATSNS